MKVLVLLSVFVAALAVPVNENDPMINEGLFEGDILSVDPFGSRNAVPRDVQRWPDGVVPYIISPELANITNLITSAMRHIETDCIRFVKRTDQSDYIKIFKHTGCYSNWGRIGKEQLLSLGPGCDNFAVILHELLHAIGFEHEHNRSDRDDYLIVKWNNINEKKYDAFRKLAPNQSRLLEPFDYNSIMLYGSNSFVKVRNQFSMVTKQGKEIPDIHNRTSMSYSDARRIKLLYNC